MLAIAIAIAAAAAPVHLSIRVPGATFDGDVPIATAPAASKPADVLAADAVALADLATSLQTIDDLDDYGRVVFAAAAIDALPVVIRPSGPTRTVSEAIAAGEWTARDRRLAIGAVLRDEGYDVIVVNAVLGAPVLGLRTSDTVLNVDALTIDWSNAPSERWVLWDGDGRIGHLGRSLADLTVAEAAPARGHAFAFVPHVLPAFVRADLRTVAFPIAGTHEHLEFDVPTLAPAWLALYPELEFAAAVDHARAAVGPVRGLDHLATAGLTEPQVLDRLLRTVQGDLTYRAPTPLEPIATTLTTRVADCDGYALLLAVLLLDLGYSRDDLRGISWPDHQALAIHPRATGPVDATSVDVGGRDYFILDPTYFETQGGTLISRWGDVPYARGTRVAVEELGS